MDLKELSKDKKYMTLVGYAELAAELLERETASGSLIRIDGICDTIRDMANKSNPKLNEDQAEYFNRIFERALEKSIKALEKDYHQSEIYFIQDLLSHIRSYK